MARMLQGHRLWRSGFGWFLNLKSLCRSLLKEHSTWGHHILLTTVKGGNQGIAFLPPCSVWLVKKALSGSCRRECVSTDPGTEIQNCCGRIKRTIGKRCITCNKQGNLLNLVASMILRPSYFHNLYKNTTVWEVVWIIYQWKKLFGDFSAFLIQCKNLRFPS